MKFLNNVCVWRVGGMGVGEILSPLILKVIYLSEAKDMAKGNLRYENLVFYPYLQ